MQWGIWRGRAGRLRNRLISHRSLDARAGIWYSGDMSKIFSTEIDFGNDVQGKTFKVIHVHGDKAFVSIEVRQDGFGNLYVYDYYGRLYNDAKYSYFASLYDALKWFYEQEKAPHFVIRGQKSELSVSIEETDNEIWLSISDPFGDPFGWYDGAILYLVEQETAA